MAIKNFAIQGISNALNALMLGVKGCYIKTKDASTVQVKDTNNVNNVNLEALRLISTQTTGTSPLSVVSTTTNTNFNADMLDDFHAESLKKYHGVVGRPVAAGTNPLPTIITTTTFTLGATANPITYYYQGTKVIVDSDKTVTLSDGAGLYYIYFNTTLGTLSALKTLPAFSYNSNVIIASVNWNGTDYGIVRDERHSYIRNTDWHIWSHDTIGCRYESGITLTHNGGTGAGATFSTTAGNIHDEDIDFDVPASSAFPTANTCRLLWQTGANTYTFDKIASTIPFKIGVNNRPVYIKASDFSVVEMSSAVNRYINFFVYATSDLHTPIYIITESVSDAVASNNGYTSLSNARAVGFPNISSFGAELKPIYRLIVRADGVLQALDTTLDDYRTVTSLPQSAGNVSTTASSVSFSATGNYTATSVQTAFEQVDSVSFQGAVINGATAKNTPIDADIVGYVDTEASNVLKKTTWANIKAFLKTYFDTVYAPIGGGGGGLSSDYAKSSGLGGIGNY